MAPHDLRERFTALIRREAGHARAGRPCGIRAKMNQLQDPQMIRELYQASLAGVPINLNIRGLRAPPGCTRTWACSAQIPNWPRTQQRSSTS